jgi:hypothetical protein
MDDPAMNGATADTYSCDPTDYPDGITYSSDGDLTLEVPDDSVDLTVNEGGVNVTGNGTDDIFWDSSAFELGDIIGTDVVLDYLSDAGSIDILVGGIIQGADDATHVIRAESTGGGDVTITTLDRINPQASALASVPPGNGIEALATSGDITIDTRGIIEIGDGNRGILAQSGSGTIIITTAEDVNANNFGATVTPADAVGIEAITDSGDIFVTAGDAVRANKHAVRAFSNSGNIDITIDGSIFADNDDEDNIGAGLDARTANSGNVDITITDDGSVGGGATAIAAGSLTVNLFDNLSTGVTGITGSGGRPGLTANAGGDIDIYVGSGRWLTAFNVTQGKGVDLTTPGDITITVSEQLEGSSSGGRLDGGFNDFAIDVTANSLLINNGGQILGPVDFTGLTNGYIFNNSGTWDVSVGEESLRAVNAQRLSLLGAGTFNNSGTVAFGREETVIQGTGTTFNGLEGSTLDMLMTLSSVAQTDCANPVVAGCLLLPGGTTTGMTEIRVGAVSPPLDPAGAIRRDANPGIVLVDVSGGTTAAEHFVLSPDSQNYVDNPIYGGSIGTGGPLLYALLYNPDTQQHVLTSVPDDETITYGVLGQQMLSMWHTSADAVVGRQADLRADAAPGGWIRVVNDEDERASTPTVNVQGNTFVFEKDYTLDITTVMLGMDAHTGDNHVLGLHTGFLSSDLSFDGSNERNRTHAKGAAAGVYGSWWMDVGPGQLTLDGTVNFNFVRLEHKNSFENTETDVRTNGVRAEAGWILPVSETFYVQPLATAAYVRADIETIPFRANDMHFVDTDSSRAALGVRLGGDKALGGNWLSHLKYWLTARAWEESAEDGVVQFPTSGEPLKIEDNISESFEEVGIGASLRNADGTLSFFLSGNVESGDQTDSFNVTAGARMRW